MKAMFTLPPATGNHARPHGHSVPTLASIGFLAYFVVTMCHEVLGHGVAFYMFGAHHFVLTSTSMDSPDTVAAFAPGTSGYRFICAAGSLSTILLGVLVYPLLTLALRKRASMTLRIFLWLVAAVGIFHGFCYIIFSGLAGVGDWSEVIAFWPHQTFLRVLEVVFGTLICAGVVRFFAALFGTFPESLTRIALVPYASATFIFCLVGLRIPNGTYLMLSVLPASLMGQAILLFVTPVARRLRKESVPDEVVPTSPTALFFAAVFTVMIFLTAPGVHFMVP